ncbi:MAG TPA: hypothetical protein VGQ48_01425 [Gemmatimonadales bacterium]|jgi:hypothetical protein|nr:hypothetical protein [Gemmatimonadales bacterium]
MKRYERIAGLVVVIAMAACDLNVGNPNAPDAPRAFSDPAGLEQLLSGAIRTWVETRENYFLMGLNAQADNYTASWNNAAMRFYSSVGSDCPSRCGWTNSSTAPEAAGGPTVEAAWYGYHTVLSSANDVLGAVGRGICFDDDCSVDSSKTYRAIALAKMLQGMALGGISMLYDSGFAVDETTDLSNPRALPFASRAAVRDFALQKFNDAYAAAGNAVWNSDNDWFGLGGKTYSSVQIQQLIRTMQAELIALWPRNGAENAAADWASVVAYASQGVSSGTPYDWSYFVDINAAECGSFCIKAWGNSVGTVRVDTRVAAMLASNHADPWPDPGGNPCPTISADRRVGDGSWGPEDDFNGYATTAATANAGTDFACSGVAPFNPARGQYHQSNLAHIRYNHLGGTGERLPEGDPDCPLSAPCDGSGDDPLYTTQMNDLLWAEGLIRSGGDKNLAATLINNSRVGRGGLTGVSGADADTVLFDALHYEQEIEFMGQGTTPLFNRRRSGTLIAGTPRQMPVPAKEMDVLLREVYTFGGPTGPDMSASVGGTRIRSVGEIFNDYRQLAREYTRRRR